MGSKLMFVTLCVQFNELVQKFYTERVEKDVLKILERLIELRKLLKTSREETQNNITINQCFKWLALNQLSLYVEKIPYIIFIIL